MSFTSPVEDHPDFTRANQWVTAPVLNVVGAGATVVPTVYGPFYVGGYESVLVSTAALQAAVGFTFRLRWWADAAATVALGDTTYRTFSTVNVRDQTPNRGPVLTVEVASNFVAAKTYSLLIQPRTGSPPGGGLFGDGMIANIFATVIGAGGNATAIPNAIVTGPGVVSVASTVNTWRAQVLVYDELAASFASIGAVGSGGEFASSAPCVVPPYYCQLQVVNTGAAGGTFNASLTVVNG